MHFTWKIITLIVSVCAVVRMGESLQCYHCVQATGGECDRPSENDNFIKECPQKDMVCVTKNTTNPTESKIERDCAPKNTCGSENDKTKCVTCEEDLCNSSNYVTSPFTFVWIGSILLIINRYY